MHTKHIYIYTNLFPPFTSGHAAVHTWCLIYTGTGYVWFIDPHTCARLFRENLLFVTAVTSIRTASGRRYTRYARIHWFAYFPGRLTSKIFYWLLHTCEIVQRVLVRQRRCTCNTDIGIVTRRKPYIILYTVPGIPVLLLFLVQYVYVRADDR